MARCVQWRPWSRRVIFASGREGAGGQNFQIQLINYSCRHSQLINGVRVHTNQSVCLHALTVKKALLIILPKRLLIEFAMKSRLIILPKQTMQ